MEKERESKKIQEGFLGQGMIVIPPEIQLIVNQNLLCQNLFFTAIGYYPKAFFHDRERGQGAEQYILLYCVSGTGTILINNQEYSLNPNQYFLLPKQESHHYFSSKENPWSIYWIHFDGKIAYQLYNRFKINLLNKNHEIPYNETRLNQFNLIFLIIENSYGEESLEAANLLLYSFLVSFIYHEKINQPNDSEDQVSEAIKFMKKNLDKTITIEELANELKLSVSHYSTLFKTKTGFSPIQYFNKLKVHQSCQYLYFTDMSIKEICNKIGFNDPYYFSRLFKKSMKISPLTYRNKYKRINKPIN